SSAFGCYQKALHATTPYHRQARKRRAKQNCRGGLGHGPEECFSPLPWTDRAPGEVSVRSLRQGTQLEAREVSPTQDYERWPETRAGSFDEVGRAGTDKDSPLSSSSLPSNEKNGVCAQARHMSLSSRPETYPQNDMGSVTSYGESSVPWRRELLQNRGCGWRTTGTRA